MEETEKEMHCYLKAVEINPGFWGGHMKLGLAQDKAGDHHSATKSLKKATELEPRNKNLWAILSKHYQRLGQEELAQAAMDKFRKIA